MTPETLSLLSVTISGCFTLVAAWMNRPHTRLPSEGHPVVTDKQTEADAKTSPPIQPNNAVVDISVEMMTEIADKRFFSGVGIGMVLVTNVIAIHQEFLSPEKSSTVSLFCVVVGMLGFSLYFPCMRRADKLLGQLRQQVHR